MTANVKRGGLFENCGHACKKQGIYTFPKRKITILDARSGKESGEEEAIKIEIRKIYNLHDF